jgi:hypothetical protein
MSRVERDPERGRAAAARLRVLGVKGILIKSAEQGHITQLACKMAECFCREELGACYCEPVTDELSDWMPCGVRKLDSALGRRRMARRCR